MVDRRTDALVRATAAEKAVHRLVNLRIGWLGMLLKQCRRAQNLPALAIPALGDIQVDPRLLYRVQFAIFGQSFNGDDLPCRL